MNRLFIDLFLDEDVDILVADLMRSKGFFATTAREAGRLGHDDVYQLAYAVDRGLALLTHNREDFEALAQQYFEQRREHFGIIIAVRQPPHMIVRRILAILNHTTADEMRNQLRYI